jgi:TPR repeat protein
MINLGFLLDERGDKTEAEQWYRKAADTGDTRAMTYLGFLLDERGDKTEAEQWYRKAADTGHEQ